jgi:hypothetical protein
MRAKRRYPGATNGRRGFQVLELLFAVPVLAFLLLATVEFGQVMMVRSGVTQAATVAAREAGKGGNLEHVTQAVDCVLAAYGVAISDKPGSGTKVVLHDGCGTVTEYGDPGMALCPLPAIQPDEIVATVWIHRSAKRADGRKLIAASHGVLGFAFDGKQLCMSSLVKKEHAGRTAAAGGNPSAGRTPMAIASRDASARGE